MDKKETIKRYIYFFIGLFVNSLGVAFITQANLGTSPISSIPYVLSLNFDLTLGQFTILFNLLLVVLQIIILKKNYQPIQLLQIIVAILFGYFIDFSMDVLLVGLNPQSYGLQILSLLVGCVILGLGVFMEVSSKTIMLPGEGVATAISIKTGKEFGTIKVLVDVSMCVAAVIISLAIGHNVVGVREGTVIAALLVGFISRGFSRMLNSGVQRILSVA